MTGRSPLQPSTIGRPALEQRLDAALAERRLTCVVAGPGFGKTTLLSHWAETTPLAMSAWHGMTAGDRTLSALVRAVTDALRLCVPGLPADLVTAVSGPRGPDTGTDEAGRAEAYAGRICAAVAEAHPRPLVLVLDDVEVLDGAAESTAFLAALCRQASPPLHVALASRGDVPFPVARLRGQGLLAELSAADLAFSAAETAEVFSVARAGGPLASDTDGLAAELHAMTAGWPAAVRLAAEALARRRSRGSSPRARPPAPAGRGPPRLPGGGGGHRRATGHTRPAGAARRPRPLHPRAGRGPRRRRHCAAHRAGAPGHGGRRARAAGSPGSGSTPCCER